MTRLSLILTTLALSTTAVAHGPGSDFIWSNPETAWCCNHLDCRPAEAGEAVEGKDGVWTVGKRGEASSTFQEGQRGFYYSRDLTPWLCQYAGQKPRCFFAPPRGF